MTPTERKMNQLEKRLARIEKMLQQDNAVRSRDWVTADQVMQLTSYGKKSLQNLRKEGKVTFRMVGKKIEYSLKSLETLYTTVPARA